MTAQVYFRFLFVALIFVFVRPISYAQTILYSENFTGQTGKGVVGPLPLTYDTSGVSWTIDPGSTALIASSDWARVDSYERFECRDLDGDFYWYSDTVIISGSSAVDLEVKISESGTLEPSDYIKVYYIVDNGTPVLFSQNGSMVNDFDSAVASQDSIVGNTIQIMIKAKNNAGSEYYYFDNITVSENVSNVQNLYSLPDTASITAKWGDPLSPFDQILVVVRENMPLDAGQPTGNGSAYTPDTTLGIGTYLLGGWVVYNDTGNSVAFNGITANNTYYIKVFTRRGTRWSLGTEISMLFTPIFEGDIIITEHARHSSITEHSYLELYNSTGNDINLSGAKIIAKIASVSSITDLGIDIPQPAIVPANGFLILNRDRAQVDFEASPGWNVDLSATGYPVNYIRTGVNDFGNGKYFQLRYGGTENTNDGLLIDESTQIAAVGERVIQLPIKYWTANVMSSDSATPGAFAPYENPLQISMAFADGAWQVKPGVSYTAPSSTTGSVNAAIMNGVATFTNGSALNDLYIWGGAAVDLANETVTINNDLTVENGGSLAITGSGDMDCIGTLTFKQTGFNTNTDYSIWGSPFSTLMDLQTVFTGANPCDMYVFEASTQLFKYDFTVGSSINCLGNTSTIGTNHVVSSSIEGTADGNFDIARGYFIPGSTETTVFSGFSAAFNNGTITANIYGSSGPTVGTSNDWNLIANPYPSALKSSTFLSTNSSLITNAVYIYTQGLTTGSFATYNTSDGYMIAPAQGFYVDAATSTDGLLGTVTFQNTMRTTESSTFEKRDDIVAIYLSANTLQRKDILRIYFDMRAKEEFDFVYDAHKMPNSDFNFASWVDNRILVFNGVPELNSNERVIPLYFQASRSGSFSILLDSLAGDFSGKDIVLEDRLSGVFVSLRGNKYEFRTEAYEWNNRFFLHVLNSGPSPTGIAETENDDVRMFQLSDQFILQAESHFESVQLIDMFGRIVKSLSAQSNSVSVFTNDIANGAYIVSYQLENGLSGKVKMVVR